MRYGDRETDVAEVIDDDTRFDLDEGAVPVVVPRTVLVPFASERMIGGGGGGGVFVVRVVRVVGVTGQGCTVTCEVDANGEGEDVVPVPEHGDIDLDLARYENRSGKKEPKIRMQTTGFRATSGLFYLLVVAVDFPYRLLQLDVGTGG